MNLQRFRPAFGLSGTGGREALLVWTVMWQVMAVLIVAKGPLDAQLLPLRLLIYGGFGFAFAGWIAAVVRRLHDMGRSGLFAVLFPVPVIGIGFLVWALFGEPRQVDPSRYSNHFRYVIGGALLLLLALGFASRALWSIREVPSNHMAPTLSQGDLVLDLAFWKQVPKVGQMVTFILPGDDGGSRWFVSRAIAGRGQAVSLNAGILTVDGIVARQQSVPCSVAGATCAKETIGESDPYLVLDIGMTEADEMADVTVPDGTLFVLGDNRDRSFDSRQALEDGGVGFIPVSAIRGRAIVLDWGTAR